MTAVRIIKLKGGAEVTTFLGNKTVCKGCKQEVVWVKTKNGKAMPINQCEDGEWESHFASCPNAKKFRKSK